MPRPPVRPRSIGFAPTPANASELHRQWLELVDSDGPFLAVPPLRRVWPQGMPNLPADRKDALTDARKDFENAWEKFDSDPANEVALEGYRVARDGWVRAVLGDVAGWAESMQWGEVPGVQAQSPNRAVTVTAHAALVGPEGIGALVQVIDPTDSLRTIPSDLWAATPIDRMEAMLRENNVEVGVVTDGRWWGLVCARDGAMVASGVVDALTWIEEPRTRDAFLALLGRQHLVGGDPNERLPVLFAESVAAAEEITEALGAQVRLAVELLIQSFSESAADAQRRGLPNPLPTRTHDVYEAAVTTMMRIVFLLFAEERGLLPAGDLFEQGYGISRELDRLLGREQEESEEALDATSLTWHRLLATSQALFAGASFESMRMPAYGGSLFEPQRFPFLTATTEQGTLAVTVSDRVMLHALKSVQLAVLRSGDARRISFRDIDVEQIGYIYEGLLGYSAVVVDQPYLGLAGTRGQEPEIPLSELERLRAANPEPRKLAVAVRAWVEADQPSAKPQTEAALTRALVSAPDPTAVSALAQAVGDDAALREQMLPWLGLTRLDLRKRPFVVMPGGLLVKETPSRKNAGAHYTPKSLAKEVVLHALQPLCYSPGPHQTAAESAWKLRPSEELLALKVADIACGSGAFLVAAAEYLAERVVEAWVAEDPTSAVRKDLHSRAIRQVVAGCLYGADINDMAVEMCKLSLWLVSLDRDLPFSFVDDKVFCGNSLLGLTSLKQLRNLHIDEKKTPKFVFTDEFDLDIDGIIRKASDLRRALATPVDDTDPARSANMKNRQLTELRRVTARLRELADAVVAAGLPLGGKQGRALDEAYENLRIAAKQSERGSPAMLDDLVAHGLAPTVATDYERWAPLHWVIEAPEVVIDNGGFDAIVGNPPFLGGKKISGAVSTEVREWLVNQLAGGIKGNADLVAYFFLRATSLLQPNGTLGLIATNTLAQGDTREVGLDAMVARGLKITRAIQSRSWPASSANLEYAAVWGTLAEVASEVPRVADDIAVRHISALLEPTGRAEGNPFRLEENAGIAFVGCNVNGKGFELPLQVAVEMLETDPRNAEVVKPLLGGEDVNQIPDLAAPTWIIDFYLREREDAATFAQPFAWLERYVRPHRDALKNKPKLAERWWRFERDAVALRKAIRNLDEVLVIALVSKTVMPMRVPTGQVFSHMLGVFALDSYSAQAVLSSSLHQAWAITYGSTLETRVRYTPSDVFETFPRATATDRLDAAGRALDEERREIMLRRDLGLTKLYNLVNDPAIQGNKDVDRLREIHVEIDAATMAAYNWDDVPLRHGFHTYRQMERWSVGPAARVEMLDRLLEENQRRAGAGGPADVPAARADSVEHNTLFD